VAGHREHSATGLQPALLASTPNEERAAGANLIAVLEANRPLDALAVEVGAVGALEVFENPAASHRLDLRMPSRHGVVGQGHDGAGPPEQGGFIDGRLISAPLVRPLQDRQRWHANTPTVAPVASGVIYRFGRVPACLSLFAGRAGGQTRGQRAPGFSPDGPVGKCRCFCWTPV